MNLITKAILIPVILLLFTATVRAQEKFNYPDNYRHSKEMTLDPEHVSTAIKSDRDVYNFFFDKNFVFKQINNPREIPKNHKKEFREPMNIWQIMMDRLKPKNIFIFSPLTQQSNTPQRLLKAVTMGVLMDQDRKIYNDLDTGMRKSSFWSKQGKNLTLFGDGMVEVGASSLLYLIGGKKNREVSQMLMESAMSLRIFYIKRIIGYTRPSEHNANIGLHHNYDSMPSGHTAVAFSMATILGESYDIKWLTYPLAILSGLSRIQQNTHWPSDVFAGAFLGHAEAREILARHNYLPTAMYAESKAWDNTRVDIETGLRVYNDSYANMERANAKSSQVGQLLWRWRVDQKLSDNCLIQVNYHWRGVTPGDVQYNAAEDVYINPRLAVKVGPGAVLMGEYTYSKVQFDDLARSNHNDRAMIPDDLNYCRNYIKKYGTGAIMLNIRPDFYLKPSYRLGVASYKDYSHLNSTSQAIRLDAGFKAGAGKKADFKIWGETGREETHNPAYSYKSTALGACLDYQLAKKSTIKLQYLGQRNRYTRWDGNPTARWNVFGAEYSQSFHPTWDLSAGYFRRNLKSDITGWPYAKNQYYLETVYKF